MRMSWFIDTGEELYRIYIVAQTIEFTLHMVAVTLKHLGAVGLPFEFYEGERQLL